MSKHWTSASPEDFMFAVAMDFLSELEQIMDERGISRREIAKRLGISKGLAIKIMESPGNLTLGQAVELARAMNIKVALVSYDDDDHENVNGPVFSRVFRECWEALSKPVDGWSVVGAINKA